MITTHKTTRGNNIFVLNYAKFQELDNYKTRTKSQADSQARTKQEPNKSHTINNNEKIIKSKECVNSEIPSASISDKNPEIHSEIKIDIPRKLASWYQYKISKQATSGKIVIMPALRDLITDRLREFKPVDLILAIDGFADDNWEMNHNGHRGAVWFFQKAERIEQYLGFYNKNRKEDYIEEAEKWLATPFKNN